MSRFLGQKSEKCLLDEGAVFLKLLKLLQNCFIWSVSMPPLLISLLHFADSGIHLNQGKFRKNGGCGYILKPDSLRNRGEGHSGNVAGGSFMSKR